MIASLLSCSSTECSSGRQMVNTQLYDLSLHFTGFTGTVNQLSLHQQHTEHVAAHEIQTTNHAANRNDERPQTPLAYCLFLRLCDTRVGETLLRRSSLILAVSLVYLIWIGCNLGPIRQSTLCGSQCLVPASRKRLGWLAMRHLWIFPRV